MLCTLLLLLGGAIAIDGHKTITIPFKVENKTGGQAFEQVFLEHQYHAVLRGKNIALNMTIISSDYVSLSADKCGRRIFETVDDVKNTTFLWNAQWFQTLQTDIHETCTLATEYSVDFTINCNGPCTGNLYFSVVPIKPVNATERDQRTNQMSSVATIKTIGGGGPVIARADFGLIADASFLNPHVRLDIVAKYSTNFTLAIGKCGAEFLAINGDGSSPMKHTFDWEEVKSINLVRHTQCPNDMDDTMYYMVSSDEDGNGTISFAMRRLFQTPMKDHPGGKFDTMELAIGIPKHGRSHGTNAAVSMTQMALQMALQMSLAAMFIV